VSEKISRVKIATQWLAGCAGCHMSILDLDEELVKLLTENFELTSCPITDLKHPPQVEVGILEGAVADTSHEEVAREMRARCKILIAIGDCAVFGGVVALRNLISLKAALQRAYVEAESVEGGKIPNSEELAVPLDRVKGVDQVTQVDVYIPGCPPSADAIGFTLKELLAGRKPVLSGDKLRYD